MRLDWNPFRRIFQATWAIVMLISIQSMLGGNFLPGVLLAAKAAESNGSVSINPKFYALNPCEKRQFTASVMNGDGREITDAKVTWQSTDPKVAKIDEKGLAVGIKPGVTMIMAIYGDAEASSSSLVVRDKGIAIKC